MAAGSVQVEYKTLDEIAKRFLQERDAQITLRNKMQDQLDILQSGAWEGENADFHFQEMNQSLLPAMNRLIGALASADEAIAALVQIFEAAEDEGRSIFSPDGGGFSGGGGGGGGGGGVSKPGGSGGDFWDKLGQVNSVREFLKIFQESDDLRTIARKFDIGGVGIGSVLTFLGHLDEEPDLLRGGGIAVTDAVVGFGLGVATGGVSLIVEGVSAVDQLAGWGIHAGGTALADAANINPELRGDIKSIIDRYQNTVQAMDIGEVRYDISRLAYDLNHDITKLPEDLGKTWDTVSNFAVAAFERRDHEADLGIAVVAGTISHAVNTIPGVPDGLRNSINSAANEAVEFANQHNLIETPFALAQKTLDWLF